MYVCRYYESKIQIWYNTLDKYLSLKSSGFSICPDIVGVSGLKKIEWLSRSDKAENFELTNDTLWCKKLKGLLIYGDKSNRQQYDLTKISV